VNLCASVVNIVLGCAVVYPTIAISVCICVHLWLIVVVFAVVDTVFEVFIGSLPALVETLFSG
jgi:hypothetical protein